MEIHFEGRIFLYTCLGMEFYQRRDYENPSLVGLFGGVQLWGVLSLATLDEAEMDCKLRLIWKLTYSRVHF